MDRHPARRIVGGSRSARTGRQLGSGRRLLVWLPLLVAVAVLPTRPAPATDEASGVHHDHGRFTAQAEGYPPQPVGAVDVGPVPSTAFRALDADARGQVAVDVAMGDPAVRRRLGDRHVLVGVDGPTAGGGKPAGEAWRVTWYAHDIGRTVEAVVRGGRVTELTTTPAATWQPPLSGAEVEDAIAVARRHWVETGRQEVGDLRGFAMHTMDADDSYPSTRMAYVTFAAHVDARPRLLAWVDLTSRRVVRDRVEAGAPSPAAPTHGWQGGDAAQVPRSGEVDFEGWSLRYDVSGREDGLSLSDVTYREVPVLARASMPAMTVFYDDDACGPFVDRLGGELTPVDWADGSEVVLRQFTLDGERWLEIGILDTLGEYVLYQAFYVGEGGQLDAHTFAKGIQCDVDHLHLPFWRFDVDLADPEGDQVLRRTAAGTWQAQAREFATAATAAVDHGWQVRDGASGHRVAFAFDDGSWTVPGEVVPETAYAENRVYGLPFGPGESGAWRWPALRELPVGDGLLTDEDVVLWYRGHLPHSAAEGPALWHSTGVRLTVHLAPTHYVRQR